MKNLLYGLCCLALAFPAQAQRGELPLVRFETSTYVCDTTPWKLVFQDDFEGDSLKAPWVRFMSWANMPGGDNDDWEEGRLGTPYNAILTDQNVVVSDGTVKLKMKKEPATWTCATCGKPTHTTKYTASMIALPYTRPFNSGRFEARIKMPTFKWAHTCFWLTFGSSVNEIDIAEAYGNSYNNTLWLNGGYPHTTYSLHTWPPKENIYGMVHENFTGYFPGQRWNDWLSGNHFQQEDFHTYTCEWDTAVVRFYLDGVLMSEQWKYHKTATYRKWWKPFVKSRRDEPSGCVLEQGEWDIMETFPYNNESLSSLRLSTGIDKEDASHKDGFLGEMEVDYVKIWQRHPEKAWPPIAQAGIKK
jgi:hypothetical protein